MDTNPGRLSLQNLATTDAPFIVELLNTPGWIRFIGDRNIRGNDDALAYIIKVLSNKKISYLVARLTQCGTPIGIISFIKRDYLEHFDLGFAFLPTYSGKGYAFEAAATVLDSKLRSGQHDTVLATTMKENESSIRLLLKLGFHFQNEITVGEGLLQLYSVRSQS